MFEFFFFPLCLVAVVVAMVVVVAWFSGTVFDFFSCEFGGCGGGGG